MAMSVAGWEVLSTLPPVATRFSEALYPDTASGVSLCGNSLSTVEVLFFKVLENGPVSQPPCFLTYIPRTGFRFYINWLHFPLSWQVRAVLVTWLYTQWTWLDPAQQSV